MSVRHGLILLLAVAPAFCQTERGNITGQVRDSTGSVVPGAQVVATQLSTNLETKAQSSSAGEYNLSVTPGVYGVTVSAPGFKRYVRNGVTVAVASTVRLDAVLEVGAVSESIEVRSDVSQIQTESAKVSSAVQNLLVDELPLVVSGAMRSPFDLTTLTPESHGSGTTIQLGGGQAAAWSATIDGLSVNTNRAADAVETSYNTPSVEAITEFTIDTNGFKAEYGQAGGGVMTFSSKSGTNNPHGEGYDFLRNDDVDARGFFARTRSVYKQNDFGATLGGPVYLPKIYNGKNRTFFFLSYEGFRQRAGSNGSIFSVPTPEMYKGDFSKWVDSKGNLLPIYDPATTGANPAGSGQIREPFPGNQVPLSSFSTLASQIIPYAEQVTPNRGGMPGTIGYVQNNYITTGGNMVSPDDKASVKVDHTIHNNHRLGFFSILTVTARNWAPALPACRCRCGMAPRRCTTSRSTGSPMIGRSRRLCSIRSPLAATISLRSRLRPTKGTTSPPEGTGRASCA